MDAFATPSGPWALEPFGTEGWPTARRLLLACYPGTPAALWDSGFQRLKQVPNAPSTEPLGMILTSPQGPTGLALLLASQRPGADGPQRMVNVSSWGILPRGRERALWMARTGLAEPRTAYTALTPMPSLHKLLLRIGFRAVTHQTVLAATPRLAWTALRGPRPATVLGGAAALRELRDDPLAMAMQDHVRLGCEVLALQHESGIQGWVPLVFRPQRRLGWLRTAEVLYAPSQALVADQAHALALPLLKRGYVLLAFEAHEELLPDFPCTRLFQRRYARAVQARRGIDHLYSELVYLHR
jgi:hypothetical protein